MQLLYAGVCDRDLFLKFPKNKMFKLLHAAWPCVENNYAGTKELYFVALWGVMRNVVNAYVFTKGGELSSEILRIKRAPLPSDYRVFGLQVSDAALSTAKRIYATTLLLAGGYCWSQRCTHRLQVIFA